MITSTDAEKAYDKKSDTHIKTLSKLGIEGTFPNVVKEAYIFCNKLYHTLRERAKDWRVRPTVWVPLCFLT